MELVCRQCGSGFWHVKAGRGPWPAYCSQRCSNRYHYEMRGKHTPRTTKNSMKCSSCAGLMWRSGSSLPEGEATCNPCRRARAESFTGLDNCRLCGKALSDVQRRRGGQYCSSACGYVHILRVNPEPYDAPHKRFRRFGVCRAVDKSSGLVIYGPGRRQKLSLHRYDDGHWTICCRLCMNHVPIELGQVLVQCPDCLMHTELDRPLEEVSHGSSQSSRRRTATEAA